MPRTAPPPYAGELCRNADDGEQHDLDITRRGSYYGLCSFCRVVEADRRRERRESGKLPKSLEQHEPPLGRPAERDLDGLRDEVQARSQPRRTLKSTIEGLAEAGDRLEQALVERDAAAMHARIRVAEFKEALQAVGRAAQSLLNTSPSRNGDSH